MIAVYLFMAIFALIIAAWAWYELRRMQREEILAHNREHLISSLNEQYGVPLLTEEQIREIHAARWDGD